MPKSKIPSPSRSQGGIATPRRQKSRNSRSLCSPALSTASGRLTSIIDQFKEKNMDSFALSPLNSRWSVLTDNTDIEEPRRKSWWKNLNENSRDVMEVLGDDQAAANNAIEDIVDIEVLSQEKKNFTLDLPESSDNESVNSIVLPQRKLFTSKENQPQNKFGKIVGTRETLAKLHKTNTTYGDKTITAGTKELFQGTKRSKPVFPAALLTISPNKTAADKTKENIAIEPKPPARNIFGKRPANKRKNIFADFIVSESEDEVSEIQPSVFGFQKKVEQQQISSVSKAREHSPRSSITTDMELDEWKHLPSSTMVENQLEEMVAGNTPVKRARLSKLSEDKEFEGTVDKTKQSNKSFTSKDKSRTSPRFKDMINTGEQEYTISITPRHTTMSENKQNRSEIDTNINTNDKNKQSNKSTPKDKSTISPSATNTSKPSDQDKIADEMALNEQEGQEKDDEINIIADEHQEYEALEQKEEIMGKEKNIEIEKEEVASENQELNGELEKHLERSRYVENDQVDKAKDNLEIYESQEEENKVNESHDVEEPNESRVKTDKRKTVGSQKIEKEENQKIQNNENLEIEADENNKVEDDTQEAKDESQEFEDRSQEIEEEENRIEEDENDSSQEIDEDENDESHEIEEGENVESQVVEDVENDESQQFENDQSQEADEDESQKVEEDGEENSSLKIHNEINESQENDNDVSQSDEDENEVNRSDENNDEVDQNHEVENDYEHDAENENNKNSDTVNESQEMEHTELEQDDDTDENDEESEDHQETDEDQEMDDSADTDRAIATDEMSEEEQEDMEVDDDQNEESNNIETDVILNEEVIKELPDVTHDTTGRNRKKIKSPEVILHDKTNQQHSFTAKGRNTSIRETKSMYKGLNIRPSLAPPRDSVGLTDGTKDSSAEGSGWDSHRITRKTLRQTFGKDITIRKSLRALVMEKTAKQIEHMDTLHSKTVKLPQANSTEYPEDYNCEDNLTVESDHEVSRRTRQTTLEMYLQKIKQQNIEKKLKMEEAIRNSIKAPPSSNTLNLFKVPSKPPIRKVKIASNKPKKQTKSTILFDELPSEVLEDMQYKPPKRFRPTTASWVTNRLYKYLECKLEQKYDYKARVRSEKLVETIYHFVRDLRQHDVASPDAVDVLKHELARLEIVRTHFEFYEFCHEFLPREARVKIIPDVVNKISLPRQGVFADILTGNTVQR